MASLKDAFRRSVDEQIAINQARTPTERLLALCDLLDAARAMAPAGAAAEQRRRDADAIRRLNQEQWRARCRQLLAAERTDASTGV